MPARGDPSLFCVEKDMDTKNKEGIHVGPSHSVRHCWSDFDDASAENVHLSTPGSFPRILHQGEDEFLVNMDSHSQDIKAIKSISGAINIAERKTMSPERDFTEFTQAIYDSPNENELMVEQLELRSIASDRRPSLDILSVSRLSQATSSLNDFEKQPSLIFENICATDLAAKSEEKNTRYCASSTLSIPSSAGGLGYSRSGRSYSYTPEIAETILTASSEVDSLDSQSVRSSQQFHKKHPLPIIGRAVPKRKSHCTNLLCKDPIRCNEKALMNEDPFVVI